MTIRAMPATPARSSFCRNIVAPTSVINTVPAPDYTAYATPTGMRFKVTARNQNAIA